MGEKYKPQKIETKIIKTEEEFIDILYDSMKKSWENESYDTDK